MNDKLQNIIYEFNITPFPVSPTGEKLPTSPSPLEEGWDGGNMINESDYYLKIDTKHDS
jgi:hypothetical protein